MAECFLWLRITYGLQQHAEGFEEIHIQNYQMLQALKTYCSSSKLWALLTTEQEIFFATYKIYIYILKKGLLKRIEWFKQKYTQGDLHSNQLNYIYLQFFIYYLFILFIYFPPISSLYKICISAADIPKHLVGLDCWIMGNAKPYNGAVVVRQKNMK